MPTSASLNFTAVTCGDRPELEGAGPAARRRPGYGTIGLTVIVWDELVFLPWSSVTVRVIK